MRPGAMLAAAMLGMTACAAAAQQERPNLVVMMTDNLGWGEIGTYGGGILRGAPTPRLDALAEDGLKLLNYNVEPQCTPSPSAFMTGRHPIRSGTTKVVWGLPYGMVGWEVTIAELFSEAGYRTGMFGKWHLGDQPGRYPTDQGFDVWYGIPNTTDESQYTSQFGFDPEVVEPPQIVEASRGELPEPVQLCDLSVRPLIDGELAERAMGFMEEAAAAGEPFLVFIPFTQAHLPALPHPDFISTASRATANGPTCWRRWITVPARSSTGSTRSACGTRPS